MDEIIDSIRNGQRVQALEQLYEAQYSLDELFDHLIELGMYKEISVMYRIAINQGHIVVKD